MLDPLVWSAFTVMVPLYEPAVVGWKRTVTDWDAPGAIGPLVQLKRVWAASPPEIVVLVTVSVALPELVTVYESSRWPDTGTSPNARLPLTPMMRVGRRWRTRRACGRRSVAAACDGKGHKGEAE